MTFCRLFAAIFMALLVVGSTSGQGIDPRSSLRLELLRKFQLPSDWLERFWSVPETAALLDRDIPGIAAMVPAQAGFRYCRCPSCGALEREDPLTWSLKDPEHLKCRVCAVIVPNDTIPAHLDGDKNKPIPEEKITVLPNLTHGYPYHQLPPKLARYPGERVYLNAKRDYETRAFLTKAALYAAVAYRDGYAGQAAGDARFARLSATILLRFAQVYPSYATHFDQMEQPKYLQPADLRPPYRRMYQTGKWEWSGALNVPLELLLAHSLLKDSDVWTEVGNTMGQEMAPRFVEDELLRPAAEFLLGHPDPHNELSLHAARGLLATGRLLEVPQMVQTGLKMLDETARAGFYHDGLWQQGELEAQKRVLGLFEGWFRNLVTPQPGPDPMAALVTRPPLNSPALPQSPSTPSTDGELAMAMFQLARRAEAAELGGQKPPEVVQAGFDAGFDPIQAAHGRPMLLGGAGLVRLSVGTGPHAMDLELRGLGSETTSRFDRLAFRLAVGGEVVLGDWNDTPPRTDGWDRASVSHNLVTVNGLNQRESPQVAQSPAPGADILFHAVTPGLQVVTMSDSHAYPSCTTVYRHTVVAVEDPVSHLVYAVSLFEVEGGQVHEQFFHAPHGRNLAFHSPVAMRPGPESLLPPSIVFVPDARAEDGRWFVQAAGRFDRLENAELQGPSMATLHAQGGPRLRLHLMNGQTSRLLMARSPGEPDRAGPERDTMIVQRAGQGESPLSSRFVTLFEPVGAGQGALRVGLIPTDPEVVALLIESAQGVETLVIHRTPGTERKIILSDGSRLTTDALVTRLTPTSLTIAGGTFARNAGREVRQSRPSGNVLSVHPSRDLSQRGWFEVDGTLSNPDQYKGRTLLIRHGDGPSRAWTIQRVEPRPDGHHAIHVIEEPAFQIDPESEDAVYYQFPMARYPGPHSYRIPSITVREIADRRPARRGMAAIAPRER